MRVLVSVASKHGATAEIADAIAEELGAAGLEAVRCEPGDVSSLDRMDAAVIGSAVYAGRWLEPARRLVEMNVELLAELPVWLFSSGPVGVPPKPDEEPRDAVLAGTIGAREHRTFPGRIDRRRLGLAERAIVAGLRIPDGDFRDFADARAWARTIATALKRTGHEVGGHTSAKQRSPSSSAVSAIPVTAGCRSSCGTPSGSS